MKIVMADPCVNQIHSILKLTAIILLLFSGTVQAALPWYAEDYGSDLSERPEDLILVEQFSAMFAENSNGRVDAGDLSSGKEKIHYISPIAAWYEGLSPKYIPEESIVLHRKELAFYHSSSPECGIASVDGTGVHLYWEHDYRFAASPNGYGVEAPQVTYILSKRLAGGASFQQIGVTQPGESYFYDNFNGPVSGTYEYKIWTFFENNLYEYTDGNMPIVADPDLQDQPIVRVVKKRYMEEAIFERNSNGQVLEDFSIPWNIDIEIIGSYDLSKLTMEVIKKELNADGNYVQVTRIYSPLEGQYPDGQPRIFFEIESLLS